LEGWATSIQGLVDHFPRYFCEFFSGVDLGAVLFEDLQSLVAQKPDTDLFENLDALFMDPQLLVF